MPGLLAPQTWNRQLCSELLCDLLPSQPRGIYLCNLPQQGLNTQGYPLKTTSTPTAVVSTCYTPEDSSPKHYVWLRSRPLLCDLGRSGVSAVCDPQSPDRGYWWVESLAWSWDAGGWWVTTWCEKAPWAKYWLFLKGMMMMMRIPVGQRTSFIFPEVVPFRKWFDSFLFPWLVDY